MTTINTERLLLLADFLETKMPKAKWNFGYIIQVGGESPAEAFARGEHQCGTVGCAIGWTPACFPDLVEWSQRYKDTPISLTVVPKGTKLFDAESFIPYDAIEAVSSHLFGLSPDDASFLFMPGDTYYDEDEEAELLCDADRLPDTASAADVAAHIRKFVAGIK